jgi:hypothetical protein
MNLPGQGIQLYGRLNWRNLRDSSNDVKIMDNSDSLWDRRDFSVIARYRAPSPCQWPIWANECSTVVRLLKSRRPEAVDWRARNSCIKASSGWMDTVCPFLLFVQSALKGQIVHFAFFITEISGEISAYFLFRQFWSHRIDTPVALAIPGWEIFSKISR